MQRTLKSSNKNLLLLHPLSLDVLEVMSVDHEDFIHGCSERAVKMYVAAHVLSSPRSIPSTSSRRQAAHDTSPSASTVSAQWP